MKALLKKFFNKIPYVKRLKTFETKWYPGHYYSPIPLEEDVFFNEKRIFAEHNIDKLIREISFNDEEQLDLMRKLKPLIDEHPFTNTEKVNERRFYHNNGLYSNSDAIVLQAMIRYFKPQQIIEAGSGFTSAIMLDTNEVFFNNAIQLMFIEPYPDRLNSLLRESDRQTVSIMEKPLQDVPLDYFYSLKKNDILFIDSTHVAKTGSDVNYIFFEILPILQSGVLIHFHDIFFQFEYLKSHFHVNKGFGWNENYLLRSFLMYNDKFSIKLFTNYLDHRFKSFLSDEIPSHRQLTGANFWMVKK